MNQIVYLLGAGASYGERDNNNQIKRGVPIVSEFEKTIDIIISKISRIQDNKNPLDRTEISNKSTIIKEMQWLKQRCVDYPTIDTYAKMLNVKGDTKTYNRLKKALSVFLLLIQDIKTRDLRYDGFIASIINGNRKLPSDIHILSWNYDAQFELAYSGYMKDYITLPFIWHDLNVIHKNLNISHSADQGFLITKLNGTAFFIKKQDTTEDGIQDIYFQNKDESPTSIISKLLTANNIIPTLSFAWEKEEEEENEENDTFIEQVKTKTNDAEVLVVIGYSFPYVNREIDKKILDGMHNLKKIYVQDPNADEIKESLLARLYPKKETDYEWKLSKNTRQFIIPNELI